MTTTCESCRGRLIDYHYLELDVSTGQQVAEHLSQCSDCAVAYCRLHADLNGIAKMLEDEPGPQVLRNLKKEVRNSFAPKPRWLDVLQLRIPVYQPVVLLLGTAAVWLAFTYARAPHDATPAPTTAGSTGIGYYDARTVVSIHPSVL